MKLTTFCLTLLAIISLPCMSVKAQELEVTPGKMTFATNPGSSQTQQVYVRNKGNSEQSFIFNLADWLTDEKGEAKYFSPGTTSRSCANWITVSPSLVTLQPNESTPVNVTMLVPNDNFSTKWAVLFVESAKEKTGVQAIDKNVQMGINVAARIAVPIFQSPAGNTLFKGTIEQLTETVLENNTRKYESLVINLGDKILNCKVYYTIASIATAEEITSEPVEFSLLPESSKKIAFVMDKPLAKGRYSVTAILDYGFNDNLEGIELEIEVK